MINFVYDQAVLLSRIKKDMGRFAAGRKRMETLKPFNKGRSWGPSRY